jgi:hypothetical protein
MAARFSIGEEQDAEPIAIGSIKQALLRAKNFRNSGIACLPLGFHGPFSGFASWTARLGANFSARYSLTA